MQVMVLCIALFPGSTPQLLLHGVKKHGCFVIYAGGNVATECTCNLWLQTQPHSVSCTVCRLQGLRGGSTVVPGPSPAVCLSGRGRWRGAGDSH